MSTETVSGKFDQLKGQIKQSFGEATGDEGLANSGAADQIKGHLKEAWGNAKDASHVASSDAKSEITPVVEETKLHGEDVAHGLRDKMVNVAQSVKDAVVRQTDDVKNTH